MARSLLLKISLLVAFIHGFIAPALSSPIAPRDASTMQAAGKAKVKVTEFFSYTCPHCFRFENTLDNWKRARQGHIEFERVHVIFGNQSDRLPRLYFALQVLGAERLHDAIFRSVHVDHVRLDSDAALLTLVTQHGVNRELFLQAYNSSRAFEYVQRNRRKQEQMRIMSVPTLVVADKFTTSLSQFAAPVTGWQYVLKFFQFSIKEAQNEEAAASQALKATDKYIELASSMPK